MRELFPERQNTFRQGAGWPKFAGCVLALMLLATSAVANPQLDLTNPTGFFTNVAMAMFRQMDLHDFNGNLVTVTNIPIYEDPTLYGGTNINYYTPAVHRILQLAANIFEATTNRFIDGGPTNYPTVFRPVFRSLNGVASIVGYEEVSNSSPVFLPFLEVTNFVQEDQTLNDIINIYGVPWVIGVKKGFPNFNEISMNNPLTVTRKIEFTNSVPTFPWQTNQLFDFSITNSFGIEAWNSYTNSYGRSLRLIVTNSLNILLTANQGGTVIPLLEVQNVPYGNDLTFAGGWPGWNPRTRTDNSFQVPLYAVNDFTNGIYIQNSPYIMPLDPQRWDLLTEPPVWMTLGFRLQYVLIDTSVEPNRVLDFVNIVDTEPPVNIASTLANNDSTGRILNPSLDGEWDTNFYNGTLVGPLNQVFASEGAFLPSDWHDTPAQIGAETALFRAELGGGITNYFQTPYNPTRTIYQGISWEVNDPLVHYAIPDLTSTNGFQANFNRVSISQAASPLSNLTNLNFAYQPWGGYHLPGGSSLNPSPQYDDNYQVKDPLIGQSDDWNFPTGEPLTFEWLGRVHRGTPWQTVFLKPSNQSMVQWIKWDNDNIVITNANGYVFFDAAFTYPNIDWHIASLWAQWVNTNDLSALLSTNSSLLSINNTDTNAWAARLDGLTALTNSAYGELDPITISSNSPQAGIIAQAIQTARANTIFTIGPVFPNQSFQQVGDVLATPQLSVASPFINTNGLSTLAANGITDEALEEIPTQLLPLLRVDSIGQIVAFDGQLELSFSGYDGHTYAIQASSNLTDWVIISTNCPSDGNFGITNTATSGQQFYRSVLLH